MFDRLYQHYKDDFDVEMRLEKSNTTYRELAIKTRELEDWF
jgi:hypothetical protein